MDRQQFSQFGQGSAKVLRITGIITAEKTITATIKSEGTITGTAEVVRGIDVPDYEGDYSVTPGATAETLDTKGRRLKEDISILPVPMIAVENESGGTTVTIG